MTRLLDIFWQIKLSAKNDFSWLGVLSKLHFKNKNLRNPKLKFACIDRELFWFKNWPIIYEMTRGRENLISKGYLLIKFSKQKKTYINNYAQPLYSCSLYALKNGSVYGKALSLEYSIGSTHYRGYVRGELMSNISFMISRKFAKQNWHELQNCLIRM